MLLKGAKPHIDAYADLYDQIVNVCATDILRCESTAQRVALVCTLVDAALVRVCVCVCVCRCVCVGGGGGVCLFVNVYLDIHTQHDSNMCADATYTMSHTLSQSLHEAYKYLLLLHTHTHTDLFSF